MGTKTEPSWIHPQSLVPFWRDLWDKTTPMFCCFNVVLLNHCPILLLQDIREFREKWDPSFPDVRWICFHECYGKKEGFVELCSNCLRQFRNDNPDRTVATFVGAGTHFFNQDVDITIDTFERFWNATPPTIFATLISIESSKTPEQYKGQTFPEEKTKAYLRQIDEAGLYPSVRMFDYYQLTLACRMDNCTADGGHRSRFVNRWKVLLNTLCSFS